MHIHLTGLNQTTAPVAIREMASFSKVELPSALGSLKKHVNEAVLLSTCNRTEFYTWDTDINSAPEQFREFLRETRGADISQFTPHLYDKTDSEASEHLFRVASGLDSMILGESEILGQVREALSISANKRMVGPAGSQLFHAAIRTGRKVRNETNIGRNALSVGYAAVKLAQQVLGNLDESRVLLIGAGDAGQLVAHALNMSGVVNLTIANRTLERAQKLSEELGGSNIRFDQIHSALAKSDIVIAASEAPGHIISATSILPVVKTRRNALFLLDLSVPRNIDPLTSAIDGVYLYNIDDLSNVAEKNLRTRQDAVSSAEKIIKSEVDRFMTKLISLDVEPVIRALRNRATNIRKNELDKAIGKLGEISPEQIGILDSMTRSIVNRLLHEPTSAIKKGTNTSHIHIIRQLFELHDVVD